MPPEHVAEDDEIQYPNKVEKRGGDARPNHAADPRNDGGTSKRCACEGDDAAHDKDDRAVAH
jgi:hypothetical protein